jgi:very-short-patch-repair endonuclease
MGRSPADCVARARSLRRAETDPEYRLWYELKAHRLNGFKFVRQLPIGPYFADFACRSHWLIVELDGGQHSESPRDVRRTEWLNVQGYSVLRFWNDEVMREREAVLETILAVLDGRLHEPSDGGGPSPGLRFAPATLSPVGRGMARPFAPLEDEQNPSPEPLRHSSPRRGEGGPKGRMRGPT